MALLGTVVFLFSKGDAQKTAVTICTLKHLQSCVFYPNKYLKKNGLKKFFLLTYNLISAKLVLNGLSGWKIKEINPLISFKKN